jgi:soluble lytic murein transglycosylase-like protein
VLKRRNRAVHALTEGSLMKFLVSFAWLGAIAALPLSQSALARDAQYDALVATHAKANNLPEALVHRVIVRESGYRPHLVSHGNIGLMQIKLGTARGLGYTGTAEGLRDPDTNLTYAVKYLAGAYRSANGDHKRAVRYYASGYYHAAKRQRQFAPPRLEELTANAQPVVK